MYVYVFVARLCWGQIGNYLNTVEEFQFSQNARNFSTS
jgi:hypothetical protein